MHLVAPFFGSKSDCVQWDLQSSVDRTEALILKAPNKKSDLCATLYFNFRISLTLFSALRKNNSSLKNMKSHQILP